MMQNNSLMVIGITGGVGSGKSLVLDYLNSKYRARILEADKIGHRLMEPGQPAYKEIVDQFGEGILTKSDKTIDRAKLGRIVFCDSSALQKLNHIIHPKVKAYILTEIEKERDSGNRQYVAIEAALLLEDHYETICDELWYIYTDDSMRRERLTSTRGYTEEYINHIMSQQKSEVQYREGCQVTMENNGSKEELFKQIDGRLQS